VIEGVVFDAEHGRPGVRVWLRDWDLAKGGQRSGSVTEVITDRRGRYRFLGALRVAPTCSCSTRR
jgi:hypothetical protein